MLAVSTDSLWVRISQAEPLEIAFWVQCCALFFHATLGRWIDRQPPLESLRKHPLPLIGVGLLGAVSSLSFITAITETRVANVVAIVAATPLVASIWAWLFLGERITRRVAVAIALTMVGIAVIVGSSVGQPTLRGDLLAVLAILAFASSLTIWRRHSDLSRRAGLSISAVVVIAVTSFWVSPFSLDLRAYLSIAAMGLCFNTLGRLANSNAPRFAPVSEVALFTPVETVAGTLWAAVFLSELPRPAVAAGAVVVLSGVIYGTIAGAAGEAARLRLSARRPPK